MYLSIIFGTEILFMKTLLARDNVIRVESQRESRYPRKSRMRLAMRVFANEMQYNKNITTTPFNT